MALDPEADAARREMMTAIASGGKAAAREVKRARERISSSNSAAVSGALANAAQARAPENLQRELAATIASGANPNLKYLRRAGRADERYFKSLGNDAEFDKEAADAEALGRWFFGADWAEQQRLAAEGGGGGYGGGGGGGSGGGGGDDHPYWWDWFYEGGYNQTYGPRSQGGLTAYKTDIKDIAASGAVGQRSRVPTSIRRQRATRLLAQEYGGQAPPRPSTMFKNNPALKEGLRQIELNAAQKRPPSVAVARRNLKKELPGLSPAGVRYLTKQYAKKTGQRLPHPRGYAGKRPGPG